MNCCLLWRICGNILSYRFHKFHEFTVGKERKKFFLYDIKIHECVSQLFLLLCLNSSRVC